MIDGPTHETALAGADHADLGRLRQAARTNSPEALREAAAQFEALFLQTLLGTMREAGFGDELFGSDQTRMYQGMFDRQISLDLAHRRGIGLADLIVRQLGDPAAAPAGGDGTGLYQATGRLPEEGE